MPALSRLAETCVGIHEVLNEGFRTVDPLILCRAGIACLTHRFGLLLEDSRILISHDHLGRLRRTKTWSKRSGMIAKSLANRSLLSHLEPSACPGIEKFGQPVADSFYFAETGFPFSGRTHQENGEDLHGR